MVLRNVKKYCDDKPGFHDVRYKIVSFFSQDRDLSMPVNILLTSVNAFYWEEPLSRLPISCNLEQSNSPSTGHAVF